MEENIGIRKGCFSGRGIDAEADGDCMIFHKYRKIYTLGHKENATILDNPDDEIIIEEKIDGANLSVWTD